MKSRFKSDEGWTLPLALMVMLVFTLLGTAAYTCSQSSLLQASRLEPQKQAEYMARSAVDATKEAWTEKWINSPGTAPTSADFYTRYDRDTDEFVHVPSADVSNYQDIIHTTMNYDTSEGICTIESKATVGNISQRVRAVSEKLVTINDVQDRSWFFVEEYFIWFIKWWKIGEDYFINGNDGETITNVDTGETMTYHTADGLVNISVPQNSYSWGDDLHLSGDDEHRRVGYGAKKQIFNCPIDLHVRALNRNPGFLVVSAESIEFKKEINITSDHKGVLLLQLPEGSGISGEVVYHELTDDDDKDKVDLEAKYGLVTFSQVNITPDRIDHWEGLNAIWDSELIENKTFYFRHPDDGNALPIAIDHDVGDWLSWFLKLVGLGHLDKNVDFRCSTLLNKGYLIEASGDIASDYQVHFTYE